MELRRKYLGKNSKSIKIILASLWAFSIIGLIGGQVLDRFNRALLIPGWGWKASLVFLSIGVVFASLFRHREKTLNVLKEFFSVPSIYFLFFAGYLFSDIPERRYGFYSDLMAVIDLPICGIMMFGFWYLLGLGKDGSSLLRGLFSRKSLLFVQVALTVYYYTISRGANSQGLLLYSDDHPSFLYRLHLLTEHFPNLPFYNTDWNAAYNSREFFPSGMLNLFLLLSPFLYSFARFDSIDSVVWYSWVPFLLIAVIAPWGTYFAARLFRLSKSSAVCAAVLMLFPSTMIFEWAFKYGTLGFVTSIAFLPLCLALAYKLFLSEELPKWLDVFLLLFVSFCVVTWSLSCFVLVPFGIIALCNVRKVFDVARRVKVVTFLIGFLLINLPWMYTFVHESKVLTFLNRSTLPGAHEHRDGEMQTTSDEHSTNLSTSSNSNVSAAQSNLVQRVFSFADRSLGRLRTNLIRVNPLMILLVLPALGFLPNPRQRWLFGGTMTWLFFLFFLGEEFKPQLELRRMVVIFSCLICIPIGHYFVIYLRSLLAKQQGNERPKRTVVRLASAFVVAFVVVFSFGNLVFLPLRLAEALDGRTDDRFRFADESVGQLIEAIKEHAGTGRVFFSGFILHELNATSHGAQDGGHIAPLPMFTGHEFYASDFYHAKWSSVDPIPRSYLKRGGEGIEEFLNLINATLVITHLREWRDYFRGAPGYREVAQVGRFRLFQRETGKASYFLSGEGKIERIKRGLRVWMKTPEVVIKYRVQPRLRSFSSEVKLDAVPVFSEDLGGGHSAEVSYIRLEASSELVAKAGGEGLMVEIGY